MAEIRETHVERDADGRVVDSKVTIEQPKRRGAVQNPSKNLSLQSPKQKPI